MTTETAAPAAPKLTRAMARTMIREYVLFGAYTHKTAVAEQLKAGTAERFLSAVQAVAAVRRAALKYALSVARNSTPEQVEELVNELWESGLGVDVERHVKHEIRVCRAKWFSLNKGVR